jgi:hypothetical protein
MLSRFTNSVPHFGQRDRGVTMLSPAGTRWITTFRNDPTTKPRTAQTTIRASTPCNVMLLA